MTKYIYEMSAPSWFYYEEICYDSRLHERKKLSFMFADSQPWDRSCINN